MDRIIWIIEKNREDLLDAQRKINGYGGMKAMCILSASSLKTIIEERIDTDNESISGPSLMLMNKNIHDSKEILSLIKQHPKLAGVPLFFWGSDIDEKSEEEYYLNGAMAILSKPFNKSDMLKLDNASEQYELSKNYERVLQKQASELEAAREIKLLNTRLESRNKFLYSIFGKYFSDELINVLLEKQEGEFIGGEKTHMAVLFSDLRGFTATAGEMEPEEITDLLNCYFGKMSDIIIKYGGTIIEFMGDGILAVFGTLVKCEDYCANAVAAAIEMQNAMNSVNSYCEKKNYNKLSMGIGVHCGEGFVGNVGTEKMMRYNIIGNVVNICSRIESCSIGGQVLTSMEIIKNIEENVVIANTVNMMSKGMKESLEVCNVRGIGGKYQCIIEDKKRRTLYIKG